MNFDNWKKLRKYFDLAFYEIENSVNLYFVFIFNIVRSVIGNGILKNHRQICTIKMDYISILEFVSTVSSTNCLCF